MFIVALNGDTIRWGGAILFKYGDNSTDYQTVSPGRGINSVAMGEQKALKLFDHPTST